MTFIANHPSYAGMPDAVVDDGKIQWEAPSNRKSGRFKDTHIKRLEWWRRKAVQIGIDPRSTCWISRTAKAIHPTKKKPCKRCGEERSLQYVYPQARFINKLFRAGLVSRTFEPLSFEDIGSLISRVLDGQVPAVHDKLYSLFNDMGYSPENTFKTKKDWLTWLAVEVIPNEPKLFSPGAMSNAPDRFDGFHSFNICCRSKADTGRHKPNMNSYTTDRRVFEYWTEGNWVAADRLMGLLRSKHRDSPCRNGHPGPCDADHIGPISLGFTHRPQFQMLCKTCNSAKNNRMSLADVKALLAAEKSGEIVVSWYAEHLWNLRKKSVTNDETALRLSKLMRDNRHSFMELLGIIRDHGHLFFLTTFLELDFADSDFSFPNLTISKFLTCSEPEVVGTRENKYALTQKARRLRVAFESLDLYFEKENRNAFSTDAKQADREISHALKALESCAKTTKSMDDEITCALACADDVKEQNILSIVPKLSSFPIPEQFAVAKSHLKAAMRFIGDALSLNWDSDRYVRGSESDSDF